MQRVYWIIISSIILAFSANAQVFDSGLSEAQKNHVLPSARAVQDDKTFENTTEADLKESMSPFVRANIKLEEENTEPEKVYDNSVGKITEFKIVNGKVEYADPNDRKILVYTENYKIKKGMDGIARCSLRIYVLNDLTERINTFGFKLIWPEISTSMQMKKVNPGVRTYNDVMLLGNGCFSMDKTPTIEVNRCRVKGKTQEECANAVHWFKKDK